MNNLNHQKFMSIFNDLLTDKNGTKALNQMLKQGDAGDEVDKVMLNKERSLEIRLDQRNILFLKKVEEAKQKILNGTYGDCEDCGDSISPKRLQARPTAGLCISCQEDKERVDFSTINKRRDLNSKKITEENDEHILENATFNSINDIAFESVVDL